MNGIHSNWIQIEALDGVSKMVIKNWDLSSSPTYPSAVPWQYKLILNSGDYMVPTPNGGYGEPPVQ